VVLHLVRHGRALPRADVAARECELDPAGFDAVWALRESGRLPRRAAWFASPEPSATQTAQLLTESDVGVLDDLREQDDAEPREGCRVRVVAAARRVVDVHVGEDVVLVVPGAVRDLLRAGLPGATPVVVHDPR
jgi:broad specificity phosphatase PhoE